MPYLLVRDAKVTKCQFTPKPDFLPKFLQNSISELGQHALIHKRKHYFKDEGKLVLAFFLL